MKSLKVPLTVFIIIIAMTAVIGAAIQQTGPQFGAVDMNKALRESNQGKQLSQQLDAYAGDFSAIFEPLSTSPILTGAELQDLTSALKRDASEEAKAKAKQIIEASKARMSRFVELQQKTSRTETETAELNGMIDQMSATRNRLLELNQTVRTDLQNWADSSKDEIIKKIRATVDKVAKEKGLSVVFTSDVVPYTANDLTQSVLDEMNK